MKPAIISRPMSSSKTMKLRTKLTGQLIYIMFYISECLKKLQKCNSKSQGEKEMYTLGSTNFPIPGEPGFPLHTIYANLQTDRKMNDAGLCTPAKTRDWTETLWDSFWPSEWQAQHVVDLLGEGTIPEQESFRTWRVRRASRHCCHSRGLLSTAGWTQFFAFIS